MTVETVIDKSLSSVLAEVTTAMVEATKEYGPEAVDLALLVYRLEAAGSLLLAAFCAITVVMASTKYIQACRKYWNSDEEGITVMLVMAGLCGTLAALVIGSTAFIDLLNVYYWAALFGYPEVMVAYKALVAAGMM